MNKLNLLFIAIALSTTLFACKTRQQQQATVHVLSDIQLEHSPDVLIVLYDTVVGKQPLLDAVKKMKAEVKYDYNLMPGMAIRKPENLTLEQFMQRLKVVKGVTNVEYDRIYHLTDPIRQKRPVLR